MASTFSALLPEAPLHAAPVICKVSWKAVFLLHKCKVMPLICTRAMVWWILSYQCWKTYAWYEASLPQPMPRQNQSQNIFLDSEAIYLNTTSIILDGSQTLLFGLNKRWNKRWCLLRLSRELSFQSHQVIISLKMCIFKIQQCKKAKRGTLIPHDIFIYLFMTFYTGINSKEAPTEI